MAGLAGLEGLLILLLQRAEGLADLRDILRLICKTLKTRRICSHCYGNHNFAFCCQTPDSYSFYSTGHLVFSRMNLKSAVLKNFVFDSEMYFRHYEVCRVQNLESLELPIKHTLKYVSGTGRYS